MRQFHYTTWPDQVTPAYVIPLLDMMRKVSYSVCNAPNSCASLLVHCSAGVGRTGAYICIESMKRQLMETSSTELDGLVNVRDYLFHIRAEQRPGLVQTSTQYSFIHSAILEYVQSCGFVETRPDQYLDYLQMIHAPPDEKTLAIMAATIAPSPSPPPLSPSPPQSEDFARSKKQLPASSLIANGTIPSNQQDQGPLIKYQFYVFFLFFTSLIFTFFLLAV